MDRYTHSLENSEANSGQLKRRTIMAQRAMGQQEIVALAGLDQSPEQVLAAARANIEEEIFALQAQRSGMLTWWRRSANWRRRILIDSNGPQCVTRDLLVEAGLSFLIRSLQWIAILGAYFSFSVSKP